MKNIHVKLIIFIVLLFLFVNLLFVLYAPLRIAWLKHQYRGGDSSQKLAVLEKLVLLGDEGGKAFVEIADSRKEGQFLLKYFNDIKNVDEQGVKPIHKAAEKGYLTALKILIEKGANLGDRVKRDFFAGPGELEISGWNVLNFASEYRRLNVVKYLLEIDTNKVLQKEPELFEADSISPAHNAARGGCVKILELLLINGYPIDDSEPVWGTPLYFAIKYNRTEAVSFLLKKGADPNHKNGDNTPLQQAVHINSPKIIRQLIKYGAIINAKGEYEMTALQFAVDRGYYESVKTLLELGANPNIAPDKPKITSANAPIFLAVYRADVKMVKLLLEYKVGTKGKDSNGSTLIECTGNPEIRNLIKKRNPVNK